MTKKVSSGAKKSGPPAHANKFAFVHNRNSRQTKKILAMPVAGVCDQCRAVIEWRKKYRKYKPLTVPKKCVRCERKNITEAYHVICNDCSASSGQCTKCLLSWDECNSSKVDLTDADSFDKIDSLSDDGSENITGQEVDVSVDRMISDDNSVDDFDQEEE